MTDGKPPNRNGWGSLLRLVLFVLVVAALIASAWLAMHKIEHHQIPSWLLPHRQRIVAPR
jgi:hypothetical protein